ncbi:hypothetical protein BJY04DRAFT_10592 [Aspergillus karnatakaensis]|uniref:uncharacterized protein n=1 Tax=Aspergillus karnatakaensis TaxID=1810916 RepID=UPI003CCCCB6B
MIRSTVTTAALPKQQDHAGVFKLTLGSQRHFRKGSRLLASQQLSDARSLPIFRLISISRINDRAVNLVFGFGRRFFDPQLLTLRFMTSMKAAVVHTAVSLSGKTRKCRDHNRVYGSWIIIGAVPAALFTRILERYNIGRKQVCIFYLSTHRE